MWRSAILAGLFLVLAGCESDAPVVEVRVSSINGGGPVLADLIIVDDQTGEVSIPEEVVVAEFTNRSEATSVVNNPGTFVNAFHLQRYIVSWRRADGGSTSGAGWTLADYDFEAATSVVVPVNSTVETGVLIAPAGMKTTGPFAQALVNGEELLLIADIDFIGTMAVGTEEEMHVYASVSVNFADFADD